MWSSGDIGIVVYDGIVNDIDCPVVQFTSGDELHILLQTQPERRIWHFDRLSGVFELVPAGETSWANAVIEAAGLEQVVTAGSGRQRASLSMDDVSFKLQSA